MNQQFIILIADRNRHIREYLQRELIAMGYSTRLANDGRQVMRLIDDEPPDLVILDPEMPYVDGRAILEHLNKLRLHIPVIVHAFSPDEISRSVLQYPFSVFEKAGDNIDGLKVEVTQVLQRWYPSRFLIDQPKRS